MGHHHRDLAGWGEVEPPPPLPPEMVVTGNAQTIADGDNTPSAGDHTDFGLSASLSTISRTFNIAVSVSALTGVSVALSGGGAGGFTITAQPSGTITAGANSNFTIRYDALTPIAYIATVTISSNELDDFTFAITASSLYSARVLAISPMRYNKLNEGSGTSIVDVSSNAFTGSVAGITWDATASPLSEPAPNFDGTNDYGNLYSAAFGAALNMDEFTVMLWVKMSALADWTDGLGHTWIRLQRDASNEIRIMKNSSNTIRFIATFGGTAKTIDFAGNSNVDWFSVALSRSMAGGGLLSAGDTRAYKSGAQAGSTQTGSVAATGSGLNSANTALGSLLGASASSAQKGWEAHLIIWNSPMSSDKLALMTI
jgi:hypothetical protein